MRVRERAEHLNKPTSTRGGFCVWDHAIDLLVGTSATRTHQHRSVGRGSPEHGSIRSDARGTFAVLTLVPICRVGGVDHLTKAFRSSVHTNAAFDWVDSAAFLIEVIRDWRATLRQS